MILRIYTLIHVIISLLGIVSGFVVIYGMLNADPLAGWTRFFLWTTVLTSVTGFFFPFRGFTPAYAFGVISLVVLALTIYARYSAQLAGHWRWTYIIGVLLAQYLNVFVLVVQSFQKIPALKKFAPTQKEAPFAVTQLVVLILFIALGIASVMKFHV